MVWVIIMTTKNLSYYAKASWLPVDRYYDTITNISASTNGNPLVECSTKIFWFDHISDDLFDPNNLPASSDGIIVKDKAIYFVEFKSGFKKKITKNNFNMDIAKCESKGEVCQDYWDLFFKKQKKDTEQLINSIRDKAIESYITLDKNILPKCLELTNGQKHRIVFIVVIDEDGIDNMEAALAGLSSNSPSPDNCFENIKKSLKRCYKQTDANGQDYYYDEIKVMSPCDFVSFIERT